MFDRDGGDSITHTFRSAVRSISALLRAHTLKKIKHSSVVQHLSEFVFENMCSSLFIDHFVAALKVSDNDGNKCTPRNVDNHSMWL